MLGAKNRLHFLFLDPALKQRKCRSIIIQSLRDVKNNTVPLRDGVKVARYFSAGLI